MPSADINNEGRKAGHSQDALKRARKKLKISTASSGFSRTTYAHDLLVRTARHAPHQ